MTVYRVDPNKIAWSGADGSSWNEAYGDLSYVLDSVATNGDTVLVRAGTIVVSSALTIPLGVSVYGGYPPYYAHNWDENDWDETDTDSRYLQEHATVIDAAFSGPCFSLTRDNTVLDGFWIRNGYRSGSNGGAITMTGDGVTISNCTFTYNVASSGQGGAIYILGSESFDISRCDFGRCSSVLGGAVSINSAYAYGQFDECRFEGNYSSSFGGGVYINEMDTNNSIAFTNCIATQNEAVTSGGFFYATADSASIFEGCTICDNKAGTSGGGIYQYSGGAAIGYNTILRHNEAGSNAQQYGMTRYYINEEDGSTGSNGNIDEDPVFRNSGEHPYEPIESSGNCDAADMSSPMHQSTDYLHRTRYDDPDTSNTGAGSPAYADIGAYEYQGDDQAYVSYLRFRLELVCDGENEDSEDGPYYTHAIVGVPQIPAWWCNGGKAGKKCTWEVMRELYIDDTGSWLDLEVSIGTSLVFDDQNLQVSPAHSAPDWTEPLTNTKHRGSLTYSGKMAGHVSGSRKMSKMAVKARCPRFAVLRAKALFAGGNDDEDQVDIFNLYVDPRWDDMTSGLDHKFHLTLHNGETYTDRYDPDMPMSSYHIRHMLMDSLMRIQFEARDPMTIPIFGLYSKAIVVV